MQKHCLHIGFFVWQPQSTEDYVYKRKAKSQQVQADGQSGEGVRARIWHIFTTWRQTNTWRDRGAALDRAATIGICASTGSCWASCMARLIATVKRE